MHADEDQQVAPLRREYGSYPRETRAIRNAVGEAIAALARKKVHALVPEENTRRFFHGQGWSSPASPDRAPNDMVTIRQETSIGFADVADQNLSKVLATITQAAEGMAGQQVMNVFQAITKACDSSGNVVDAVNRALPDAFMEMLEKIEFGIDQNGEVEMPTIAVGPGMGERMLATLETQPPEFQARAEALIAEKKAGALSRERARLERYRQASPD